MTHGTSCSGPHTVFGCLPAKSQPNVKKQTFSRPQNPPGPFGPQATCLVFSSTKRFVGPFGFEGALRAWIPIGLFAGLPPGAWPPGGARRVSRMIQNPGPPSFQTLARRSVLMCPSVLARTCCRCWLVHSAWARTQPGGQEACSHARLAMEKCAISLQCVQRAA